MKRNARILSIALAAFFLLSGLSFGQQTASAVVAPNYLSELTGTAGRGNAADAPLTNYDKYGVDNGDGTYTVSLKAESQTALQTSVKPMSVVMVLDVS